MFPKIGALPPPTGQDSFGHCIQLLKQHEQQAGGWRSDDEEAQAFPPAVHDGNPDQAQCLAAGESPDPLTKPWIAEPWKFRIQSPGISFATYLFSLQPNLKPANSLSVNPAHEKKSTTCTAQITKSPNP
jgi:hypothetical protein